MNEFTIVTVIARPIDEVFAVLTDLERMPLWVPGMTQASVTSDGPLEAGSALLYCGAFLGRGRPVRIRRSCQASPGRTPPWRSIRIASGRCG